MCHNAGVSLVCRLDGGARESGCVVSLAGWMVGWLAGEEEYRNFGISGFQGC